ncbi:MAG: hypothetical protein V1494_05275 [Candidatus Diapherotrites archaeon]
MLKRKGGLGKFPPLEEMSAAQWDTVARRKLIFDIVTRAGERDAGRIAVALNHAGFSGITPSQVKSEVVSLRRAVHKRNRGGFTPRLDFTHVRTLSTAQRRAIAEEILIKVRMPESKQAKTETPAGILPGNRAENPIKETGLTAKAAGVTGTTAQKSIAMQKPGPVLEKKEFLMSEKSRKKARKEAQVPVPLSKKKVGSEELIGLYKDYIGKKNPLYLRQAIINGQMVIPSGGILKVVQLTEIRRSAFMHELHGTGLLEGL